MQRQQLNIFILVLAALAATANAAEQHPEQQTSAGYSLRLGPAMYNPPSHLWVSPVLMGVFVGAMGVIFAGMML